MSAHQYLINHAEKECHELDGFSLRYQHVLTLPVFNEDESLLDGLRALPTTAPVLVILVLNAPERSNDPQKISNTQAFGLSIRNTLPALFRLNENMQVFELAPSRQQHLLLVERCHAGRWIEQAQGVGLARKIACDIACMLITRGQIASDWIHSSDADTLLPTGYFDAAATLDSGTSAAALYPFRHVGPAGTDPDLAHQLYELSLDYYVMGLQWAGSAYAFHTVGSTFLINHRHYALCRGFPKRAAGEDFYLLNKLAKTGTVVSLREPVLSIMARDSDRVPFGTGPAVTRIKALSNPMAQYRYYHPLCFYYLRAWLKLLPLLFDNAGQLQREGLQSLLDTFQQRKILAQETRLEILWPCLASLDVQSGLVHALSHGKTRAAFLRHFTQWFDAFRTLKFIHCLREHHFASQPMTQLAKTLHDIPDSSGLSSSWTVKIEKFGGIF
ncbi:MAG: hypothetical protein RQ899_07930 [Pseudomonadales bacterium]|nr:hypothetical protein [Pseudomonadales bacterium]